MWPEGKRSAVALAFDLDGPTGDAMLKGTLWDRPEYFSQGAYGPWRAVDRILGLLKTHEIAATFFVPAWVVETWPEQCRRIGRGCGMILCRHRKSLRSGREPGI